jgi:hypothetical protein
MMPTGASIAEIATITCNVVRTSPILRELGIPVNKRNGDLQRLSERG